MKLNFNLTTKTELPSKKISVKESTPIDRCSGSFSIAPNLQIGNCSSVVIETMEMTSKQIHNIAKGCGTKFKFPGSKYGLDFKLVQSFKPKNSNYVCNKFSVALCYFNDDKHLYVNEADRVKVMKVKENKKIVPNIKIEETDGVDL